MVESRTDEEYQRVLAGAFERACHGFEHGLPVFSGSVESGAVNTTVLMGSCYSLTAHPMKGKQPRLWSSWRENKGQGPTSFVLSILSFFPRSLMLSGSKVLNPADEPNLQRWRGEAVRADRCHLCLQLSRKWEGTRMWILVFPLISFIIGLCVTKTVHRSF